MSHFLSKKIKSVKFFYIAASLMLAVTLAWLYFAPKRLPEGISLTKGWMFTEPTPTGPAIGDLGGVQVTIPRHFVLFLEYDGDPHFMEKRQGLIPKRTPESKIRSFGFEIRFPDMAGDTPENLAEKKASTIFNTMWMDVGLTSNSYYGSSGDQALENHVKEFQDQIKNLGSGYYYRRMDALQYGLVAYVPYGFDEKKRLDKNEQRTHLEYKNIYYHLNSSGKVYTYIKCSNRNYESALCEQRFNLSPAMRTHVSISYRKGLLPNWREIQAGVTKTILGFSNNHLQANQTTTEGNKQ